MFFDQNNTSIKSTTVYTENFTPENKPVFLQVTARTLHKLVLKSRSYYATMQVDDLESSYVKFFFLEKNSGAFSLVSNNRIPSQGGYRYVRLSSGGNTILEIDFTKLKSVNELEKYFDAYYFETLLPDSIAQKVNISDFWVLNDLGYLVCAQHSYHMYHHLDASNMCVLTLREQTFSDFELELEFAQSWGRYGITFGCAEGQFPYSYDAESHTYLPSTGAFAYVEAEGHRTMRGNLMQSAFNKNTTHIVRYHEEPLPPFYASVDGELSSFSKPMLIYHIDADGSYICHDTNLPLGPGHLTYLPPYTRYKPTYTHNRRIVIEFETHGDICPTPDSIIPNRPDKLQVLFEKMLLLHTDHTHDNKYKILSVIYQILSEAQNSVSQDTNIPELIYPSIQYMIKNFSNPELTIADVARASNISEVYFRQVFKKATGQLPNKYILNLRINHAIFLLQSSKYKVSEIATKCGFAEIKYFMTAFKKVTGSPPNKYRNLHS